MTLILGPKTRVMLARMRHNWNQGEHVLITGGTGSGKTRLAYELDNVRIQCGGFVVVFMSKLQPDETITETYRGWTRWKRWHKRPTARENRILLWPDVEGLQPVAALARMKEVFTEALGEIGSKGKWTTHIDEGLIVTSPTFIGLGAELAMMYALQRSAKGTMITLAQRPAHLPLGIYANISHAFVGQARENSDLKRLADLGGPLSSRELKSRIASLGTHDFMHLDIKARTANIVNLAR